MKESTAKLIAWGVHLYTASGIVLAMIAALALFDRDLQVFFTALWLSVAIDATDGWLARKFRVKQVIPWFHGGQMDNIIDYITYAFLPGLALVVFEMLPAGYNWVAVLPLLASLYGFNQEQAKTEDSFVGFPSYWNVVFLYFYILGISQTWVLIWLVGLSILVFVPIHYVYLTRTNLWPRLSNVLAWFYGILLAALLIFPHMPHARLLARISLVYPLYYFALTAVNHRRAMAARAPVQPTSV